MPEGVNCFGFKLTYLIIHEIERFHCNLRKVRSGSRWQMLQVFMTGEPPEKAQKLNLCNHGKILVETRPGICSQLLQNHICYPARNAEMSKCVHNSFKILAIKNRPEMYLKLLQVYS